MSKRLYIGNLPFSTTAEHLKHLFAPYAPIEEAMVVTFKDTGRSKGFGFITLSNDEHALRAITEMHEKEVEGRKITVSEAKPFVPQERPHNRERRFSRDRDHHSRY